MGLRAGNFRAAALQSLRRPGFQRRDLDSILGVSGSPNDNRVLRGENDQALTAAEAAGQTTTGLSSDQQSAISQFLNPQLTGGQLGTVNAIAKRAVGQGLIGGAVTSQISDLQTGFQAQNRAASFADVNNIVQSGLGRVRGQTAQFFNTAGNFLGRSFGQDIGQIAPQTLRALSAVGLGGDAIAGIAQARGVSVRGGDANSAVGQGFLQFLSPGLDEGQASTQGFGGRGQALGLGGGNFLNRRFRGGLELRNRQQSGQFLADQISGRLQSLAGGAGQLEGIGLGISALSQGGLDQARTVANADVSGIRGLLQGLGFSGVPQGDRQRTSDLFRTIGFA